MKSALVVFAGVIVAESKSVKTISHSARVSSFVKRCAKQLAKSNKLKSEGPTSFSYTQTTGIVVTVDTNAKVCECDRFLDKAMCKHLAAACMLQKISLIGMPFTRSLRNMRRSIIRARIDDSLIAGDLDDQPLTSSPTNRDSINDGEEHAGNDAHEPVYEPEPETTAPKKRGRKTKAEKALEFVKTQRERQQQKPVRDLRPRN
jgi:hypothetical protein